MKRTYRIYRDLGLQLRNKTPKRRVKAKLREDRMRSHAAERDLGDGLRPRPARHRQEDPGPDGRRHVLALLAGARSALQLSRRGCGQNAGTGLRHGSAIRRRSGSTRAPSSSPAISTCGPIRRASRSTSPAGKADRQCVHRSLQRPLPGGMPERPLVPDACRCAPKRWRIGADTTTRNARTGRSGTSPRSRCSIPMAPPARHRERRPETLPSGGPKNGIGAKPAETLIAAVRKFSGRSANERRPTDWGLGAERRLGIEIPKG